MVGPPQPPNPSNPSPRSVLIILYPTEVLNERKERGFTRATIPLFFFFPSTIFQAYCRSYHSIKRGGVGGGTNNLVNIYYVGDDGGREEGEFNFSLSLKLADTDILIIINI